MVETSTSSTVRQFPDYSLCGRPPASIWVGVSMPRVRIIEEGVCVICFEEWQIGEKATELPCKHKYHYECLQQWLLIHATCPHCRYDMPLTVDGVFVDETSVSDDDSDDDSEDDSDYRDYSSDPDYVSDDSSDNDET